MAFFKKKKQNPPQKNPQPAGDGGAIHDIKVLLKMTRMKDIMSTKLISIHTDAPFREVPRKMLEFRIRHLPVVDKNNKLVGLMTQRDLYKIQPPRRLMDGTDFYDEEALNNILLPHVMIKNPFAMHPDDSIGDALLKMVHDKYGCIPVVDRQGALCGIVTQIDILKLAAQIYSNSSS